MGRGWFEGGAEVGGGERVEQRLGWGKGGAEVEVEQGWSRGWGGDRVEQRLECGGVGLGGHLEMTSLAWVVMFVHSASGKSYSPAMIFFLIPCDSCLRGTSE